MKLRIFSFVLAMMLALSLTPMAAMAASGEATQEPAEIVEEPVAEPTEESELSTLAVESDASALPNDGDEGTNTATVYVKNIDICGVRLTSGKYYTATAGVLSQTGNDTVPTSGYVHYDASTGVLTLNNISLTANGSMTAAYGITCSDSGSLTINVIDTCSLEATTTGRGINIDNANCTVSGTGTLTVTSVAADAIYVKSLTVNNGVTLNATVKQTDSNSSSEYNAIWTNNGMLLKGTVNATTNANYGYALGAQSGAITLESGAVVSASGGWRAVFCNDGALVIKGGKLTASDPTDAAVQANGVSVSGGELKVTASGTGLYLPSGNVTISGGTVNITSTNSNAIYAESSKAGEIVISNGTLTASSSSVALWGYNDIEISGGTVTAVSSGDTAIYSNAGDMTVSGGTLAATTKRSDVCYSIQICKDININGDAVVYVEDYWSYYGAVNFTKGVIYTGTAVSLDTDGKTVLTGGVGTVYSNPNVTGFAVPTGSKLGTVLDDYVKIQAEDTPYTGGKVEPHLLVRVEKIALDRNLVEDEDYTVETTETKNAVGKNSFTIEAVNGSGNVGSKAFDVNVTPKELKWDVSDITVSKVADGKTDAAQVQGTLKLVGVVEGETVTLSYTSLTAEDFTGSKAGDYNVKLTVSGAKLEGADAGNYKLPTADIMVTATIKEAAPTATATKPAQSPKTGDEANLALWLGLLTIGMAAVAVVTHRKKEN